MFRNAVAIILLFAFTVQSFSKVFLVVNYYANNAAFARDCVNKALPQMNCNGQCVLMKKIQAEQKKEQKNPELKLENKNEAFFLSKTSFNCLSVTDVHSGYPRTNSIGASIDQSSIIFRPPIA